MNMVVGTEGLMAPEVHMLYRRAHPSATPNKRLSLRADVWSLGMTFFGLACGGGEELIWSKSCLGCDKEPLSEKHFGNLNAKLAALPAGRCKNLVISALKRDPSMRPTISDLAGMVDNISPRVMSNNQWTNNRGTFYAYIIVQPSSVLTDMTAGRRAQIRRMREIEHQLGNELNFPIALSDADKGCVCADIIRGRIHSLVWFAHGAICW